MLQYALALDVIQVLDVRQISVVPPLLSCVSQGGGGGSPEKKSESVQSQLRALATRTPSLGRCGQGAWL